MTVWVLEHVACEGAGRIRRELENAGVTVRTARANDARPTKDDLARASGLVVMGGPMGVADRDRFPFLKAELALIETALANELPVLGVCLGSQLLAAALGARVFVGPTKEIGWAPVTLRDSVRDDALFGAVPSSFHALHWHGDVFDLPSSAISLASSAQTEHQAFRVGRHAYGLLFHLEVDEVQLAAMCDAFEDELRTERIEKAALMADARQHLERTEVVARAVFGAFAKRVKAAAQSALK